MGNPAPKISGPASRPVTVKSLDDVIMDELQVRVRPGDSKSASKRFEEVKKIFEKLDPDNAKVLFERLKTENEKDPLSNKYHDTFTAGKAKELVGILEAKSQKAEPKQQSVLSSDKMPNFEVARARKAEILFEGTLWQSELHSRDVSGDKWHNAMNFVNLREQWEGKEASKLDKELPRDPKILESMVSNKEMPADLRAKVLGVVLLRGGSVAPNSQGMQAYRDILGRDSARRNETPDMTYQKMAVKAVLKEPVLFDELSLSDGGEHLPTKRRPATQLMHIMLQEGGFKGDYDGQNEFQDWLEHLPSKTAGRAMYHMYDAAKSKDFGGDFKITGLGVEAGTEAASIGFSFQGEYKNTHWDQATKNISDGVGDVFGKRSPEEKRLIVEGFREANTSFELTILDKADSANREPE